MKYTTKHIFELKQAFDQCSELSRASIQKIKEYASENQLPIEELHYDEFFAWTFTLFNVTIKIKAEIDPGKLPKKEVNIRGYIQLSDGTLQRAAQWKLEPAEKETLHYINFNKTPTSFPVIEFWDSIINHLIQFNSISL